MDTQTSQQNKANNITRSVLSGVWVAILSLLAGAILDYIVAQVLSQYLISGCSEDCYFAYFNSIFFVVVLLSAVIGIRSGLWTYKRLSEKSKLRTAS